MQNMRTQSWYGVMLAVAGLALGVSATPASALPQPNLHVYADGFIYDTSVGAVGPFVVQDAATGPLLANVEAGAVLAYRYPGQFPDWELETTLFARGLARADYGTNGAAVELNLRAVNGTDRGAYPSGQFSGSLPINSTIMPHADAESVWKDTFVITGGTGLDTASVSVALHGHGETRYGANGTIWYNAEPSFETFGTSGSGSAQYNLNITYDAPPTGAPPEYANGEYTQPIRWENSFSPPLPAFVTEIGVQPDIHTGSFLFEYGVPFGLSSFLTLSGYNQINLDFNHTATLSLFDLPDGASLTSGSGHIYPVSATQVPEPSIVWLLGFGLLALIGVALSTRRSCRSTDGLASSFVTAGDGSGRRNLSAHSVITDDGSSQWGRRGTMYTNRASGSEFVLTNRRG
jgi:hypothetical protein